MKLTLLRHGETEGSQKNLYYGAADIPALPKSLEALQQKALTGVYPTAEHYYVSGMTRTIQTLRAIYGDVAYTVLPGLREMDFGDFEMRAYAGDLEHDPQFIVCVRTQSTICVPTERVRRRCWHEIWPRYSPLSTRGRTRCA